MARVKRLAKRRRVKRAVLPLLILSLVVGMVGVGTWAYFSDYEHSEDNWFEGGALDLEVDGENDPNVATYFELECLKPGDEGLVEVTLANVGCVDGIADIHVIVSLNEDNDIVEPEDTVDGVLDGSDGTDKGDLCANLDMRITADLDGDAEYETPIAEGKLCEIECHNWIIGDLPAYSDIGLLIEWWVEEEVGNIIMTDTVGFDIEFSLEQVLVSGGTITYCAEGEMLMWNSMAGAVLEEPFPVPAVCSFAVEYGPVEGGSEYRELTVPGDSWWWYPYCTGPISMLGHVTLNLVWDESQGDGEGRLYVGGPGIDVDVHGETSETGTELTWGDGAEDPAGSAWLRLPLVVELYSSPTLGDPGDPTTWGALVISVPMDYYFTTAMGSNHVSDVPEPETPEVALDCNTVVEGPGTPFAEAGGPAPYVGTAGGMVATGGVLDLMLLGFVELDHQFEMNLELAP